jgi:hypothetical protein
MSRTGTAEQMALKPATAIGSAIRNVTNSIMGRSIVCFLLGVQIVQAGQWTSEGLSGSVDDALCGELLERLNSLGEQCAEDAIETYPGFSEAPWENLSPEEHEDLVAKLLRYWQVGPRRYFDPSASRSTAEDAAYLRCFS